MTIDHMTLTLGASTVETVGTVLVAILLVGLVTYVLLNVLSGRREVGSEIELAANRKPYLDDETLETTKLNYTLAAGLVLLTLVAVGLPLYWLHEPGRQDGAVEMFDETFVNRGERRFNEGSDCAACHGPDGVGGAAAYTLLDADDEFVANLTWNAPALDTAWLRFTKEEIAEVIDFGRPGTPMAGWGRGGDGPLTEQQIDNVVDYIFSIGISSEEAQDTVEARLADELGVAWPDENDYDTEDEYRQALDDARGEIGYPDLAAGDLGDPRVGELLFNMDPSLGGGAYSCARCHTAGWSLDTENAEIRPGREDDLAAFADWPDGSGAFGPALRDEVPRQFATVDHLAAFIATGSTRGIGYGEQGSGSGRMPAFGDNPNTSETGDGMFPRDAVCAVAIYVAGLGDPDESAVADEVTTAEVEGQISTEQDTDDADTTLSEADGLPMDAEGFCHVDGGADEDDDEEASDPDNGESE